MTLAYFSGERELLEFSKRKAFSELYLILFGDTTRNFGAWHDYTRLVDTSIVSMQELGLSCNLRCDRMSDSCWH